MQRGIFSCCVFVVSMAFLTLRLPLVTGNELNVSRDKIESKDSSLDNEQQKSQKRRSQSLRRQRWNSSHTANIHVMPYFPEYIRNYPIRIDPKSGKPVELGRLELIGGVPEMPNCQGIDSNNQSLPINPFPKVTYQEMRTLLQCAQNEPDLEGNRGTMSLNRLVPPTKKSLLSVMAWLETECTIGYDCANKYKSFMEKKTYPANEQRYTGFYFWARLLRIMNGRVYLDWPWGRERFKPPSNGEIDELFFVLERLKDIPDSVFIFGTQQAFLSWRIPFPAFSESPSFKTNDIPFPWMESFRDAMHYHRQMAKANNFTMEFSKQYFQGNSKVLSWENKIPKAGIAASLIDIRQIFFDIALHRQDLIDAYWTSHEDLPFDPWNPSSSEKPMTARLIEKLAAENITDPENDVDEIGYAKQLFRSRAQKNIPFKPGHYKYLIVLTGGFGNRVHHATSGRLASYLAYSGAVVLLQESEFNYHYSARLKPWVHYVPISYSTADVVAKIEWLKANDHYAKRIAENAYNFGRSFLRIEDYYCYISTALYAIGELEKGSDVLEPFDPVLIPQRRDVHKAGSW